VTMNSEVARLHGVTNRTTRIWVTAAVKAPNLKKLVWRPVIFVSGRRRKWEESTERAGSNFISLPKAINNVEGGPSCASAQCSSWRLGEVLQGALSAERGRMERLLPEYLWQRRISPLFQQQPKKRRLEWFLRMKFLASSLAFLSSSLWLPASD
jgi:hypothetical protein